MSHQSVLTDGGVASKPYSHYDSNRETYEYISDRLERTRDIFETADPEIRSELLRHSTEYAIISVQTNVENHEPAFIDSRGVTGQDKLADIFADHVVQYHNNKARYISENRENVDFDKLADLLVHGYVDVVHEKLADQCLGLGSAKAAFSLSMLGFTSKICVDSHTANQAGLDRYASSDTSIDEYRTLSQKVLDTFTELTNMVTPFVYQWVLFDADRGGVELHDPYYLWVETVTGDSVL